MYTQIIGSQKYLLADILGPSVQKSDHPVGVESFVNEHLARFALIGRRDQHQQVLPCPTHRVSDRHLSR